MKEGVIELQTTTGICTNLETHYIKRDGNFLYTYKDKDCSLINCKINISLFYRIALYTSIRRTYKSLLVAFFDELKSEGIIRFKSRESLERATQACGSCGGGATAWMLGLFCRYYGKLPRNINVVYVACANCKNEDLSACGKKKICGEYYGCGKGVPSPLDSGFKVSDIPRLREEIKVEVFQEP